MNAQGSVTLRILERADKEILALSRAEKGAVYDFQSKFRRNPHNPGLHFKQLRGDSRLWSARVDGDHRALVLHVGHQDYLLVSVKHRREVYDDLSRYSYQINRVTGGIEVVDLSAVDDSIVGRLLPPDDPEKAEQADEKPDRRGTAGTGGGTGGGGGGHRMPPPPPEEKPLFAHLDDRALLDLGVAQSLLPIIRRIVTEDELLGLAENVPQLTSDVLLALHDGKSYDEVLEQITRPVAADEPVDPDDYTTAVARPATQVTTNDDALRAVLAESFARWQVFLHPTQRKLVDRHYNGPAKVGGGPGTGKTIVALHRAGHLAEKLPPGDDRPILLTTFNRNLAADLRTRFLGLVGPELLDRVDIVNIDRLAGRVVAENGGRGPGRRRVVDDDAAVDEWHAMLLELGENRWDAEFLAAEWGQVILGQVLRSRTEYFKARRPGRGRSLARAERDAVWQLTERFVKRLDDKGLWTWRQVAEQAARLEIDRDEQIRKAAGRAADSGPGSTPNPGSGSASNSSSASGSGAGSRLRHRYRHVVVDEAQDLAPAHWKMLRAMVAPGPNDIFLVGDTHQRLYDNYATLGSLGVNIRGRSAKLTLSYRTTRQILGTALELLGDAVYDDLDGGDEDLAGYRSLLRGGQPTLRGAATWVDELRLVGQQAHAWDADTASEGSIAVCVPTRSMAGDVIRRLREDGIDAVEIGPDGPKQPGGVHVGTMHRFKGLEYRRIIIAGVSAGLVPRQAIEAFQDTDPKRYQRERLRDRSLLFVAATRARDDLAVFWHGTPSPFLPRIPRPSDHLSHG